MVGEATPKEWAKDNVGSMMRTLVTHMYSKKVVRLAIVELVITDKLPFGIVKGQGFKEAVLVF